MEQDKEFASLGKDEKIYMNFVHCIRRHEAALRLLFMYQSVFTKQKNFLHNFLYVYVLNQICLLLGDDLHEGALRRNRLHRIMHKFVNFTGLR
jgi:hypothetical protein